MLSEAELTASRLAATLEPLLGNRDRLMEMALGARAVAVPDSADRVADLCMEYLDS